MLRAFFLSFQTVVVEPSPSERKLPKSMQPVSKPVAVSCFGVSLRTHEAKARKCVGLLHEWHLVIGKSF